MEVRISDEQRRIKENLEIRKKKAAILLNQVESICEDLFTSGDLSLFLTILSRFPHFHIYNLLLIMNQYPTATYIAAPPIWKKEMKDPTLPTIKPEWNDIGISLLAPLASVTPGKGMGLCWTQGRLYDLSQTNVTDYLPPGRGYLRDNLHLSILLDSIMDVLRSEYRYSIVPLPPAEEYRVTNVQGMVTDHVIQLRDDLTSSQKLSWLTDTLCGIALQKTPSFSHSQRLFAQKCAFHTLSLIWGTDKNSPLPQRQSLLGSIDESQRIQFLSLIQGVVRHIDSSVLLQYKDYRQIAVEVAAQEAILEHLSQS